MMLDQLSQLLLQFYHLQLGILFLAYLFDSKRGDERTSDEEEKEFSDVTKEIEDNDPVHD